MKFDDINDNLNEGPISGPAGFAARAKAKLKKNAPFAKNARQRGSDEDAIYAKAKEIKSAFKRWVNVKFSTSNIDKAGVTMSQFLEFVKSESDYGEGTEAYARGEEAYAKFFQEIDAAAETETEVAPEQGQQEKPPAEEYSDEEKAEMQAKVNSDAEEESRQMNPDDTGIEGDGTKQDVNASKGDDEKPKVDTSASIYESRLHAFLTEDEEAAPEAKPLTLSDNQVDTMIVGGIRNAKSSLGNNKSTRPEISDKKKAVNKARHDKEDGNQPVGAKAGKAQKSSGEDVGGDSESSGISINKSDAKRTKALLSKVAVGEELSVDEKKTAQKIVKYLNKFV